MGIAPRQNHMGHIGFLRRQKFHDLVDIHVIITDRDVDLVEQHHRVGFVQDQLFGFGPCGLRHFGVARFVLGFPSEAFTHGVERAFILEITKDQIAFTGGHAALDKLHNRAFHIMGDAAENHTERGRRFALTLAGIDDDQSLFVGLGRHDLIARGLLFGHLHGMAVIACVRCFIGHVKSSFRFGPIWPERRACAMQSNQTLTTLPPNRANQRKDTW